ncbi:rho GTPase-activating protein 25 isoform B [Alligator mississippiensis]|uniref:Rho GTPase-activating protein 24 n=1 Tax=Alligator mississippiensis TaxID=8496 RepID=A0A151P5T3_ALLMI|nr:rho GTPase-activating protein 25 isoform B [Alligator mississippiensis]
MEQQVQTSPESCFSEEELLKWDWPKKSRAAWFKMSLKLPRNWDFSLKMDTAKIARSKSVMTGDPMASCHRPASNNPLERPLKIGWLKKQRSIVKNWQQRYFVLRGQQLLYYKDEEDVKPQGCLFLQGSTIKEVATNPEEAGKFIFEIIPGISGDQNRPGQDSYVLMANSQSEMEEWVKSIRRVLGSPSGVVFGQRLAETVTYEQKFGQHQVPILVEKCAEFIRDHGMNEEGIFRLPGQDNLVKQLRDAFDAGERPSFDRDTDVHTVASLFKLYLRELPEPVIPWMQYEGFLLCGQLLNADEMKGHQELEKQLSLLPRDNYNLLSYICRFLHEIQLNSSVNKMSVDNLATVIGVNLIRPKIEDPAIIMQGTPQIQKVMTVMISEHANLFPMSKDVPPSPPMQKNDSKKAPIPRSSVGWDAAEDPPAAKPDTSTQGQTRENLDVSSYTAFGETARLIDIQRASTYDNVPTSQTESGECTSLPNTASSSSEKDFLSSQSPSLVHKETSSPATDPKDCCSGQEDHEILQLKKEMEMQKRDYEEQIKSLEKENYDVWAKVVRLNEELENEKKKFAALELKLQNVERSREDVEKRNKVLEQEIQDFVKSE